MANPNTTTDYKAEYANGIFIKTLDISRDRDGDGRLTANTVGNIISFLKTQKIIPQPNHPGYDVNIAKFTVNVLNEYTYYDKLYHSSLTTLFTTISSGVSNDVYLPTEGNTTAVNNNLEIVTLLNTKLNDYIQIIEGISSDMKNTAQQNNADLSALTASMLTSQARLSKQQKIITSNQATAKIRKEMVKYTEEKARYNDNLLKVYSFLNIVALGLLIYIYKAAD